jgi:ERCC4-type nuclease
MNSPANDQDNHAIIQILADDREKNDQLLLTLKNSQNTEVRMHRLRVGDFKLDHLLVERKTIQDFCSSIKDGRLFRQSELLASSYIQPLIILEGTSDDLYSTGMSREAIQGALITLSLIYRIPILRSRSPVETAKLILYAENQMVKTGGPQNIYPRTRHGRINLQRKQKMQIHVLQGFPGIGPVRSRQLLEKFGTLQAVFNASARELADMPGIGKSSAEKIINLLH